MPPRRPARARHDKLFAYALQRHRLELIASGRAKPLCERERLFLHAVKARRRPVYADYILPWPLLQAEHETHRLAREARAALEETPRDGLSPVS